MTCTYYEQVTEAYLSGEIDGPDWRSHLTVCPECAAKLRSESDFDHVIRHAVTSERLQTRQLEAHVRSAIKETTISFRPPILIRMRYGIAASVAAIVLVIATVGYAKGRIDRTAVCIDAVDDHQEEVVAKAPRKWRSDAKEVEALSLKMVGDAAVPDRIVPTGYHLVGARICLLHGKRYMHLDYSNGSEEISLFVRHQDEAKTLTARVLNWFQSARPSTERVNAFAVGSAQKGSLSLVLVSGAPLPEVQKIVQESGSKL